MVFLCFLLNHQPLAKHTWSVPPNGRDVAIRPGSQAARRPPWKGRAQWQGSRGAGAGGGKWMGDPQRELGRLNVDTGEKP